MAFFLVVGFAGKSGKAIKNVFKRGSKQRKLKLLQTKMLAISHFCVHFAVAFFKGVTLPYTGKKCRLSLTLLFEAAGGRRPRISPKKMSI